MLTTKNITLTVLLLFVFLIISVIVSENMKGPEEILKPDKKDNKDDKKDKKDDKDDKNNKETFKNSSLMNLCEKNGTPREAVDLEKRCNELNKKQCNLAECCSFIKFKDDTEEICGASRNGEPIFKNSKKNNPIKHYFYLNKKTIV